MTAPISAGYEKRARFNGIFFFVSHTKRIDGEDGGGTNEPCDLDECNVAVVYVFFFQQFFDSVAAREKKSESR
jgi:hypothetical protein